MRRCCLTKNEQRAVHKGLTRQCSRTKPVCQRPRWQPNMLAGRQRGQSMPASHLVGARKSERAVGGLSARVTVVVTWRPIIGDCRWACRGKQLVGCCQASHRGGGDDGCAEQGLGVVRLEGCAAGAVVGNIGLKAGVVCCTAGCVVISVACVGGRGRRRLVWGCVCCMERSGAVHMARAGAMRWNPTSKRRWRR